jgi:4-amino-4-deoxy-L-arabinose transferase-like glycosyltransferase
MRNRPLAWLCIILLLRALAIWWVWVTSPIALQPDEAQYWTWSQQLDWGYYSKPPAIAWQMALTSWIFGPDEVGVRIGALLLGTGAALATYYIGRNCGLTPRRAAFAGLLLALCPAGVLISLIATTDSGLVCFWAIAWALLSRRHVLWAGPIVFLAALYKWPAYLIWLFWLPLLASRDRRQLTQGLIAAAISALALIPPLIWNWEHDWATWLHVATQVAGKQQPHLHGNIGPFLAGQIALFSPIAFALWIFGLFRLRRSRGPLLLTVWASAIAFTAALIWSTVANVHGNWFLWLYPLAAVIASAAVRREFWLHLACVTALLFSAIGLAIPYLQAHNIGPHIPYRWNPVRHSMGWRQLTPALEALNYDPQRHYLVSDTYQTASLLSFYSPDQQRSNFINLLHRRRNQFCYWPPVPTADRTGLFITTLEGAPNPKALVQLAEVYAARLQPYYSKVEWVGVAPLFASYGRVQLVALIFEVSAPTPLPHPCGSHY